MALESVTRNGRKRPVDDDSGRLEALTGLMATGVLKGKALLPDLIVFDMRMPAMDVYASFKACKAYPRLRSTPFIFFTARRIGSSGLTSALGYGFTDNNASTDELTVNQLAITISGITAANKVYDALTSATVNATGAIGWIAGDAVTVSASGLFDNKNVGTGKTVTLTSSYGGADSGNDSITDQATATADITPKAISISGITVSDKVYDAITSATVDASSASGWIAGDMVSVSATGAFGAKNVGTDKTVFLSSSYAGADVANYDITDQETTTADIMPASLTVTAKNDAKTYDGLVYSGGNSVIYSGFVNGETSAVLGGNLTYGGNSQGAVNAGRYAIVPGGLTSGNYTLVFADGALEITRNRQIENVDAGATSAQNGVNDIQQDSGLNPGAANTPALGLGAGSTTMGILAKTSFVAALPAGTGSALLSCNAFTMPVSVSASETSVMLMLGSGSPQDAAVEVCALSLFARRGSEPPAPQGQFILSESSRGLSLTRTAAAAPQAGAGAGSAPSAPFTLNLDNGMTLSLKAAVTAEGVLVVTAADSAGTLDARQAILMGIQVAREALQLDPRTLKSAVFQTI